jgi:predicted TIM-barrel fold metal-dependent hydrolase
MSKRTYNLISADSHVVEAPDLWSKWMDREFHNHPDMPRLVKDEEGGDAWQLGRNAKPAPLGIYTAAGKAPETIKWTGVRYENVMPGFFQGAPRLREQDADGVDAEVLFGSSRPMGLFLRHQEPEFHLAGFQAYNNWLLKDFCAADPNRLAGLGYVPGLGIEAAIKELRRVHKLGARGCVIQCWPSGNDDVSEEDDPFWAACVELDLPVAIHVRLVSRRSAPPGPTGKQGGDIPGLATTGMLDMPAVIAKAIFSGMFDRFPDLRFACTEAGAGWLPYLLEQMDDRYWRNRHWTKCELEFLPSDYFRRNWRITFMLDHYAVHNRHACGVENLMWSTDYPHHGTDWPYSRRTVRDMLHGVPRDEEQRILALNAAELYHLV